MRKTLARRSLAALLTLTLILSLLPAAFAADSIILNKNSLSLQVGGKEQLTATSGTVNAWSSNNNSVATVDNNGNVTAVGRGSATITASDNNGQSATCAVTVITAQAESLAVELKADQQTISYGGMAYLEVKKISVTWSDNTTSDLDLSSNRLSCSAAVVPGGTGSVSIANPSDTSGQSGLQAIRVTGAGEGTVTVQVTVEYRNMDTNAITSGTANCTISVTSANTVVIEDFDTSQNLNLIQGVPKTLKAYVTENGRRNDALSDQIQWTIKGSGLSFQGTSTGPSVTVNPTSEVGADQGVTITASYTPAGGRTVSRTLTCIIRDPGGPGGDGPDKPVPPPAGDTLPEGVVPVITINSPADGKIMEPGSESMDISVAFKKPDGSSVNSILQASTGGYLIATYVDDNGARYEVPLNGTSSEPGIAKLEVRSGRYWVTASKPGEATLTISASRGDPASVSVVVSGFVLLQDEITMTENESRSPFEEGEKQIIKAYGEAKTTDLSIWSDAANIATYVNNNLAAYSPGTANFTISDARRGFRATLKVTVKSDPNSTISGITIKNTETLPFTDGRLTFNLQAGGLLSHITGINVDAGKGAMYYNYRSENQPGSGVGAESYYYPGRSGGVPAGQRSMADLTFVPNRSFPGGEVTINYTAFSTSGQSYACQIVLTVTPQGGSSAAIAMDTAYNTPVSFNSDEFNRVCQERLGSKLRCVVFSQPPERQGVLYTNYYSAENYGSVVDTARQYTLKELDSISFVPAPGYSGLVTVYYTAYGAGNSGSYAGQVSINVGRESGVSIGGLAYDVGKGGVVHFDDEDFNDYCREILYEENRYNYQTLSFIRFESLPSASQGVLYYDYRSSVNLGSQAAAGTSYYYGSRAPRIDRLSFVPAADFTGTIKIPFTGWTTDGTSFGGNVEINVRSGTGAGDIYYTCAPGRTVSFRSADFTSLSTQLTGRTIDYIVFQRLPSTADGSLYYGTSRITATGTRYRNSSLSRLSFRASSTFSGPIDIPFDGVSAGGASFSGIITIGTGTSGGNVSLSSIRYNSDTGTAAVFDRVDFDDLSQWETGRNISSVRFTPPSSREGTLYRNYRSSTNMGSRITSTTTINASDLDRVAFVPASGFNGVAYVDFTATAASGGGTFTGTVEIVVGRDYSSGSRYFSDMAGYSALQQAAVDFLYDRGVTRGLSVGQYGPESSIRRGDFARMVYLAFSFTPSGMPQAFVDVPVGTYYTEAVNALYSRGVVSGVGGGFYAPNSTLTRQDAICIVQRAMRAAGRTANDGSLSVLNGYSDSGSVAGYAQGAMAFAVQQGYLPLNGGWLAPTRPLTRVDMAEILYRVLTS